MKKNKEVLLYLHSFDGNIIIDLEHKNKLDFDSEVLRSEMNPRIKKYNLDYCEDAILDLIDLTVQITDMVLLKKFGILQEGKQLYDAVLL